MSEDKRIFCTMTFLKSGAEASGYYFPPETLRSLARSFAAGAPVYDKPAYEDGAKRIGKVVHAETDGKVITVEMEIDKDSVILEKIFFG